MMKFRKLEANEIEARVATVNANGCSLLLYKDARCDMNILDETVGEMNWQRSHQTIDGRLYCTVSIYDESKGMWISKQDVGTESYTEKEKGQASDSFKRASFNWGLGRELYTAPFIWVSADKGNVKIVDKGQGKTTYDRFDVKEIGYDSKGAINHLVIFNTTLRKVAYTFDETGKEDSTKAEKKEDTKAPAALIGALEVRCEKAGVDAVALLKQYGCAEWSELTVDNVRDISAKLQKAGK